MNPNLLFDPKTIDWENLQREICDGFDNMQEVIGECQANGNGLYKPHFFESLSFSWGNIYELFEADIISSLKIEWLQSYIYGTFSVIYAFPLTPNLANDLSDLKIEFSNDCNGLLGSKQEKEDLVFDLNSYHSLQKKCTQPKLNLPANQIQELINRQYNHYFERIDTPSITEKGNLHGEQIHIHLNCGSAKDIGALNIDGTWKHKPDNKYLPIPIDTQGLLEEWGFVLPNP